ncbi:hypothetical protein ACN08Y_09980 [Rothia sp. P5764]|uniref:hypothetical protein n=1 Tax=Rothia sp. P5764 TaxID=3402654 RepID=UPI003AD4D7ED
MGQIYYTTPNRPQQQAPTYNPGRPPQNYYQQPMMIPEQHRQNPLAGFFHGVKKVFLWLFLAFHYTALALSWIYIIVPFFGWNRYSRIFLGYVALTFFSVCIVLFIYNLLTGNIQVQQNY